MRIRCLAALAALATLSQASGQDPGAPAAGSSGELLGQRLKAHVDFLASDLLRGRQPGTEGYDIAAAYVAGQFRQLGLLPAGTDSYLQPVPLRTATLVDGTPHLEVLVEDESRVLRFMDNYARRPSTVHVASDVTAPMVFAGYGITAPALGHDDYAGIDARGKVVVILGGQPGGFPSEEGAHFASSRERQRAAVKGGAVGMIKVFTPRNERRQAWDRVRGRAGAPAMGWLDASGQVFGELHALRAEATVHYDAGEVLFEGSDRTLAEMLTLDEAGEPVPTFELPARARLRQESRHEVISSANVAALLPGGDPLLADQYVVYTAHLDHLGELRGEEHADTIHNGALDNAAGVAVMLETARLFVSQGSPRRSVVFLAVTAEEKGLVGSEYFARNPTVPDGAMVGVINLDMPVLLYDFGDVIAFGEAHSSMGEAVRQAASEAGVSLTPDPFPEYNIFTRSDHYRFVQRGVPSLYLITGVTSREPGVDPAAVLQGFISKHYHRPSDDPALPIHYAAAARFTRINARIGEIIANETLPPAWHEGDFFAETFGR